MKTSVIRARCDAELKRRVLEYAQRFGLEEADVVRQALSYYLQKMEAGRADSPRLIEVSHPAGKPPPLHLNEPVAPYRPSSGSHQSVANPPAGEDELPAAAKLAAAATAEALGERASRATSTGTVNPVKPRKTTPS